MQDRDIGIEQSAQQPLMTEETDEEMGKDSESPPEYDVTSIE